MSGGGFFRKGRNVVDHAPDDGLRRVGRAADVPHMEGRRATVAGVPVAVFNTERGFVALGGACPHKGGPLADGIVSDRCVICPLHNWRIDLFTGEVVAGGEGRVAVYEVLERGGDLYVRLPAAERAAAPASLSRTEAAAAPAVR